MTAISFIVWVLLLPILVVTAVFAVEMFAGLRASRRRAVKAEGVRAVIVVPAHDEEAVIGQTVSALLNEGGPQLAVLVVADNCTDETAARARSARAAVVVRDDPDLRGKGFALAAARDHLRAMPPDAVIVVDADCKIDRRSLEALAACAGEGRACQAINLLEPDLSGPAVIQISTFAFVIKNLVRQRGLQRLAGRAHLTGTGMALPWPIFDRADLGGANIVEDLVLGIQLAESGNAALLIEGATIWSPPASAAGTLIQRRRWEGGFLNTALKIAPKTLGRSLARGDLRGLLAALDLCIPPLALLFLLNGIAFLFALAALIVGGGMWPLLIQLGVGLSAFIALVLAWAREGRRFVSGATLLRLPLYALWKVPMYFDFLRRGAPKEWLRTGR